MSMRRRFARLFGPDPKRDVDDEIAFHIEMRIRERNVRASRSSRDSAMSQRRVPSASRSTNAGSDACDARTT